MLMMGLLGLIATPRQEDPQISVPMIDIMVQYPGASASRSANLAMQPLERMISEIPGVKHVYSAAQRGQGIVTVQFEVGEEMGPSLVKVNDKLASNMDKMPPGVMPPLVKSKGIDDVPIVTLTLWSKDLDGNGRPDVDDGQLRLLAQDVLQVLKEVPDTGNAFIVGGRREQITVDAFPERLSGYRISLGDVANTIKTANAEATAGGVESSGSHFSVTTGSFLESADEIARLVVGTYNEIPVYVYDVARSPAPEDASQLVAYYTGPAAPEGVAGERRAGGDHRHRQEGADQRRDRRQRHHRQGRGTQGRAHPEQRRGQRHAQLRRDRRREGLGADLQAVHRDLLRLPAGADRVPRAEARHRRHAGHPGGPADDHLHGLGHQLHHRPRQPVRADLLHRHPGGRRHRRGREHLSALAGGGRTDDHTAVDAVREVGNPTILATFTVIAALLPMGFVSGMMGPYMEPIPAWARWPC
jgi:hypothetical protein